MSNPFLVGEKVCLRTVDNLLPLLTWANNTEVTRFWVTGPVGIYPVTYLPMQEWLNGIERDGRGLVLFIADRKADQDMGIVLLRDIDWVNRTAQLEVAIGEKAFWGQGHALEAVTMLVRHAFDTLNLQKVWLGLYSGNERARGLYLKAGFQEEARLKRELWREGKWWDRIIMAIWKGF